MRIFMDEGMPMAGLLSEATANGIMPDYVRPGCWRHSKPRRTGAKTSSHLPPCPTCPIPGTEPLSRTVSWRYYNSLPGDSRTGRSASGFLSP